MNRADLLKLACLATVAPVENLRSQDIDLEAVDRARAALTAAAVSRDRWITPKMTFQYFPEHDIEVTVMRNRNGAMKGHVAKDAYPDENGERVYYAHCIVTLANTIQWRGGIETSETRALFRRYREDSVKRAFVDNVIRQWATELRTP